MLHGSKLVTASFRQGPSVLVGVLYTLALASLPLLLQTTHINLSYGGKI